MTACFTSRHLMAQVIMADPPWDIHMELPYGTMSDDEMRRMNVQVRRL